MPKRIAYTLFFILNISFAKAQFSETLFYDTLTRVSKEGYVWSALADGKYIYVSGSSFSQSSPVPTVTKMDTSGNVIWTAVDEDNLKRFGNYTGSENALASCRQIIKSGNRIFAIAEPKGYFLPSTLLHEVWCISDSTGALFWKVNINKSWIVNIADYNDTSIVAITRTTDPTNTFIGIYKYHLINKQTGTVIFSKHFGNSGTSLFNEPNIFVDNQKNILLSWDDTCRKYRDDRLNQLAWTSHIPYNGSLKMIDMVVQDSNRYYFSGMNNARCVDTATGATVWYKQFPSIGFIAGVQSGGDVRPKQIIIQDSIMYITWFSVYVGSVGLDRAFTLTRFNKFNGFVKYDVAHDFTGIPPDPVPAFTSEIDWPFRMCMDANKRLYMVGSYDRAPGQESPGNWGIMRINSETGQKMYEATITDDSTKRSTASQGKFIFYYNGKIYALGNLHKKGTISFAKPVIISFDTTAVYNEVYRKTIEYVVRYPSALKALVPFSNSKMALLKKVGRSGAVELRNTNNQLVWAKTFSSANKFVVPQNMTALADTGIAASFILYLEDSVKILPAKADSLLFVRLDSLGNIKFQHSIKYNQTDTLSTIQLYKDERGKTNFFYRRKNGPSFSYGAYMLNGTNSISDLGSSEPYDTDSVVIRLNPVAHYNGDTMIVYQHSIVLSTRGWLYATAQSPTGYSVLGSKTVRDFAYIYSALKLDSVSFFIMGRDSSGQIRGSRYNHRLANPKVWSYSSGINGTMFNADSSSSSLYCVSKNSNGNKLTISKLNRGSGALNWSFEKTPLAQTAFLPTDLKFDQINKYFISGGFISDSSFAGTRTSYYYLTLDSLGNVIRNIVKAGYGSQETKITVINVLQSGAHAYGGSLNTFDFGIAGFYNSDCFLNNVVPSVTISTASSTVCSGTSVTFTANAINGGAAPVYQWQINGANAGINSPTFTTSALSNNDQVKVILTSNASCLQTTTATSNIITLTVSPQLNPSASISGTTTVNQGQNALITVVPSNAGSNPAYQWQDSTNTHGWQNISAAINNTVNYLPLLTGDKIRCMVTSNASCASPQVVYSNALQFTVNAVTAINPVAASRFGIIYYPNPVHTSFIIDSLRFSDKWQTLTIVSVSGKLMAEPVSIANQTMIRLNVEHLPSGIYIVILQRKQKAKVYLKFVKL